MRTSLSILLLIIATSVLAFAQEPDIEEPAPRSKAVRPARTSAKPKPQPVKPVVKAEPKVQSKATSPATVETKPQPSEVPSVKAETKPEPPIAQTVAQTPPVEPMGENDTLPFMRQDPAEPPAEPSSSGLVIKSIGALALIIGLLFAGTWTMKKLGFGGGKAKKPVEKIDLAVISSIPMGSGRSISTIQFGERTLLVGMTASSFTLLGEEQSADDYFSRDPRSVADLLADDGRSFSDELALIDRRWESEIYQ